MSITILRYYDMGMAEVQMPTAESEDRIKDKLIDAIAETSQTLIKYGVYAFLGYLGYRSIQELAGQITFADIKAGIEIVLSDKSGVLSPEVIPNNLLKRSIVLIVPWIVGFAGIIYGKNQKKLRKQTIDRFKNRIRQLELKFDPNRSSSALTNGGETNDADL